MLRQKGIDCHQLPPYKGCLIKHTQRVNFQTKICNRCLKQDTQEPSPTGRGSKIEKEDDVVKVLR